jgi:hypothetical protein
MLLRREGRFCWYYLVPIVQVSLLINCSEKEAAEIRARARGQRRTASGYILYILIASLDLSERLIAHLQRPPLFKLGYSKQQKRGAPRTRLHIYCAAAESKRIRRAAELQGMTVSGFVLSCLHRSWEVEDSLKRKGVIRRPF